MEERLWPMYKNKETGFLFFALLILAIEADSAKAAEENRETTGKALVKFEGDFELEFEEKFLLDIGAKVGGYLAKCAPVGNDPEGPVNYFTKEEFEGMFESIDVQGMISAGPPAGESVNLEEMKEVLGIADEDQNPNLKSLDEVKQFSEKLGFEAPSVIPEELNIGFIAKMCHEVNKAYCEHLGDTSQVPFEEAPDWQVQSAISGIQFHMENPEAGPRGSHENWMREKLAAGWQYGEEKNVEEKTHPCLVDYDELSAEQRAKDAIFVAIVRTFVSNLKK